MLARSMILLLVCLLPAAQAFTVTLPNALSTSFQTGVLSYESSSRIAVHSLDGFLQEFFPEEADNFQDKKTNARLQKSGEPSSTTKSGFATGEELQSLRMDLESLRENLQWAQALNDRNSMEDLRNAIQNGENRDPDVVFQKAYQEIAKAKDSKLLTVQEREASVEKWTSVAAEARGYLPRFSLEGLWVGDYGAHGYQLINVTYDGDTLIGRKVTGDVNVPRGEVSFTANLSVHNGTNGLPPIEMSSGGGAGAGASSRSNNSPKKIELFPGQGKISRPGFKDPRNVEGQLLVLDERSFSFVWVPTKHHIHFSRPSPETTMRLLRDVLSKEDEVENMRSHVARCFEMDLSMCIARQHTENVLEPFRRIPTLQDLETMEQLSKKEETPPSSSSASSMDIFLQLKKWRSYIDQVLDGGEPLQ